MITHNGSYATISAREDIDDACPCIIYDPDRGKSEIEPIKMTAAETRKLARKLNKFALLISPRRPRR